MDYQIIMAALLHDVIENMAIEQKTIFEKFGEGVVELIDGVSKLTQIEFVSHVKAPSGNLSKNGFGYGA